MTDSERDATGTPHDSLDPEPAAPPPPLAGYVPPPIAPPADLLTSPLAAPPPPRKRRAAAVLAAGAGIVGFLAFKFLLPLILVGVAGEVLGSVFGGPFARLPADVRSSLEARFDAAVGAQLKGLPDAEQTKRVEALIEGGLPRLDDAALVTHFQLTASAFRSADPAACAAVAQALLAGTDPSDTSLTTVFGSLSDPELRRWFEIQVQGLEAEARGTPAAVVVTDAQVDPLWSVIGEGMTAADVATLGSLGEGKTVEGAAACSALRGLYDTAVALPAADLALFARYDVSP